MLALRIDAALAFAEVDLTRRILQNKMFRIQFIVLIRAHGKAQLSVYAQHVA